MLIFCEKMLMSAELKGVSRDLCIFWIFFRWSKTVPSFIKVGYVWQILERGAFLAPHQWAAPKRPILNRVKIQNPSGRIHNFFWSIFSKDFAHISLGHASFLILENFIWMHLFYFLTEIPFWFVKCLFSTYGTLWVNLPQSVRASIPCCIYRFNQPSWKIHSIP